MSETLDMLFLARAQFAFTVAFHIIFPAFTIGLASYLAMLEGLWLRTGRDVYLNLYRYWVKIFAISFGMGVVSGVVMSYQFGTNWSLFSEKVGNVLGPLLGYEVMTAFFLEASFLAIMLFGWNKVGRRLHFISTCTVAGGTLISAFWILAANSWMHTPAGYEIRNNIFYATDWLAVIFNPSFPYRLLHMVFAAYLTTAFVVIGVACFQILRSMKTEATVVMLKMGVLFIAIVVPIQLLIGHEHGINVHEQQPIKLAAMEGHWETHQGAPLIMFAIPDQEQETNHYELAIPKLGSLVIAHDMNAEIKGLKEWPAEERPPVAVVFWSFRIMVGLAMLMLAFAMFGIWLFRRDQLETTPLFLRLGVLLGPAGFIAVIAGWFTAEVGRQPYTVYGLLRTVDSVSPVTADSVGMSLIVFIFTYIIVFCAGIYYISKLILIGPVDTSDPLKGMESAPTLSDRIEFSGFEFALLESEHSTESKDKS
jgi:cytochrome bd ubiquinol oxidase subunit I